MTGGLKVSKYTQSRTAACLARAGERKRYCIKLFAHQTSRLWKALKPYLTAAIINVCCRAPR